MQRMTSPVKVLKPHQYRWCMGPIFVTLALTFLSLATVPKVHAAERSPVEKIESADLDLQKEGLLEIVTDRKARIESLIAVLDSGDKDARGTERTSLNAAIVALGELRAVEAIPSLLRYIDFYTGNGAFSVNRLVGKDKKYAAVKALAEIGNPAIPSVMKKLSESEDDIMLVNCAWVINEIVGRKFLLPYLQDAYENERDGKNKQRIKYLVDKLSIPGSEQ